MSFREAAQVALSALPADTRAALEALPDPDATSNSILNRLRRIASQPQRARHDERAPWTPEQWQRLTFDERVAHAAPLVAANIIKRSAEPKPEPEPEHVDATIAAPTIGRATTYVVACGECGRYRPARGPRPTSARCATCTAARKPPRR